MIDNYLDNALDKIEQLLKINPDLVKEDKINN